ncbi:MAG TPA: M20/M25/M40 family metallo-hydrolase [Gemmatimonadales bacterium]|nr:M20/M25/M40 family metallo-hydrolase [Gemmatimonadales bacterium]
MLRRLCPALAGVALAGAAPAQAPDPIGTVRAYRERHEAAIVAELREFLAIPNVARDSVNIRRNAAALLAMLERRGVRARLLETGGPPLVYGEIGDPSRPAILFYCHYDGQPADPARWVTRDPWRPALFSGALEAGGTAVRRWPAAGERVPGEWRVYARSASDDKSPIVALMHVLDAWRAAGVEAPNRIKFLFEGDEEAGSGFIAEAARRHRDLLAADLVVMADGPIHPTQRPTAVFGLRGIVTLRVTVYGPVRPLHSGHYGNWAPNPAMRLAQLLASMKGPDGEVLVADWEDDVVALGPAERAAVAAYPHDDETQRLQFQLGSTDGGGRPRLELIAHPSLNVRGLRSLFTGPDARTLVPDLATAELDVRLVAGNDPRRQAEKVVRHIERQGYRVVRSDPDSVTRVTTPRLAKVEIADGYPAARTPLGHPAARAVLAALSSAGLGDPVVMPTLGGSAPGYVFTDILGAALVLIPVVNHDNNQHAENENVRLENVFRGMEILASVASAPLERKP